jgi:hypothetical protein
MNILYNNLPLDKQQKISEYDEIKREIIMRRILEKSNNNNLTSLFEKLPIKEQLNVLSDEYNNEEEQEERPKITINLPKHIEKNIYNDNLMLLKPEEEEEQNVNENGNENENESNDTNFDTNKSITIKKLG